MSTYAIDTLNAELTRLQEREAADQTTLTMLEEQLASTKARASLTAKRIAEIQIFLQASVELA